jgi:hypothetical protein
MQRRPLLTPHLVLLPCLRSRLHTFSHSLVEKRAQTLTPLQKPLIDSNTNTKMDNNNNNNRNHNMPYKSGLGEDNTTARTAETRSPMSSSNDNPNSLISLVTGASFSNSSPLNGQRSSLSASSSSSSVSASVSASSSRSLSLLREISLTLPAFLNEIDRTIENHGSSSNRTYSQPPATTAEALDYVIRYDEFLSNHQNQTQNEQLTNDDDADDDDDDGDNAAADESHGLNVPSNSTSSQHHQPPPQQHRRNNNNRRRGDSNGSSPPQQ